MPVYYFHFRDRNGLSPDEQGIEFASAERAYLEAFAAAQEMWTELLREQHDPMQCAFEITDVDGDILHLLPFSEVLRTAQQGLHHAPGFHATVFKEILGHRFRSNQLLEEIKSEVNVARTTMLQLQQLLASV